MYNQYYNARVDVLCTLYNRIVRCVAKKKWKYSCYETHTLSQSTTIILIFSGQKRGNIQIESVRTEEAEVCFQTLSWRQKTILLRCGRKTQLECNEVQRKKHHSRCLIQTVSVFPAMEDYLLSHHSSGRFPLRNTRFVAF